MSQTQRRRPSISQFRVLIAQIFFAFLAVSALVTVISCSEETEGDDGGEELRPLNREQKVQALGVYLPWVTLRDALEVTPEPSRDHQVNREARAIAQDLRRHCSVRVLPDPEFDVRTMLFDKVDRLESIDIGPNSEHPNCPVQVRRRFSFDRSSSPQGSHIKGQIIFEYKALRDEALDLSPIRSWWYKGPVQSVTDTVDGEITFERSEILSGEVNLFPNGSVPIRVEKQIRTRLQGTSSITSETEVRRTRVPNFWAEWKQERSLQDGRLIGEKNYFNSEEVSTTDYEKLKSDATHPEGTTNIFVLWGPTGPLG